MTLEDEINDFINQSLNNKQMDESISFPLPKVTIKKAYKLKYIDLKGYTCIIRSREVRHVYKEHGNDVYFIKDLPVLLEKFYSIERSNTIDEKTGKTVTSIVFKKRTATNDIKIVKTNISRRKVLRLKTMFEMV